MKHNIYYKITHRRKKVGTEDIDKPLKKPKFVDHRSQIETNDIFKLVTRNGKGITQDDLLAVHNCRHCNGPATRNIIDNRKTA